MNGDIYVVVPSYNEGIIVQEVVGNLLRKYENVIVIDDGSTDNTVELLKDSGAVILRHAINLGQGAALQTGFTYAISRKARCVVTFDADGQHQIEDIEKLLIPLERDGYDVALGSRFIGRAVNIPRMRRYLLRLSTLLSRLIRGRRLTDTHNGFRAFTIWAAEKICITQDRMAHASQILDQIIEHRMKYVEVPVSIVYSDYSLKKGQSSLNALNIIVELIEGRLFR